MLNKHVKSPCCGAKVIRFGGKRRQCVKCQSTWRIRPLCRGRKPLRIKNNYVKKVFSDNLDVRQIFTTAKIGKEAVRKRFNLAVDKLIDRPRDYCKIKGRKLTLLLDAELHQFKKQCWTLYFLALKPTNKEEAIVLDPVLRPKKENLKDWKDIINTELPPEVKKRIVACVSDGFNGFSNLFKENNWLHQRCHFHLIQELQKRRGKRKSKIVGKQTREAIYQIIRKLLTTNKQPRVGQLTSRLIYWSKKPDCPKKIGMITRDVVYNLDDFHTYLKHPKLNLPNTNNVMESVGSVVRSKSRRLRTPIAWHRWAKATIRTHQKFNCKRAKLPTKLST